MAPTISATREVAPCLDKLEQLVHPGGKQATPRVWLHARGSVEAGSEGARQPVPQSERCENKPRTGSLGILIRIPQSRIRNW